MTTAASGAVQLVPGVYRLGSELVSWYLVEQEGRLTAVDAGLPGFARSLEADLQSNGFALRDVKAVVLTHADADHTGLVPVLHRAGARVLVHEGDEPTLAKPGLKGGDARPGRLLRQAWQPTLWRYAVGMTRDGLAKPAKLAGAETFTAGAELDVPGGLQAVHTPGHTPGHCVLVHPQAGVLFSGDALCTLSPVTGRRGPQLMPAVMNVSEPGAFSALDVIEPLEAKLLLPGHGEPWWGSPAAAVRQARMERAA